MIYSLASRDSEGWELFIATSFRYKTDLISSWVSNYIARLISTSSVFYLLKSNDSTILSTAIIRPLLDVVLFHIAPPFAILGFLRQPLPVYLLRSSVHCVAGHPTLRFSKRGLHCKTHPLQRLLGLRPTWPLPLRRANTTIVQHW